ncbi:UNVERIFIED_CONTAM: hypothetical protein PYX00_007812 [Menopon gallinae]|uniref:SAM domain-containing protein n=1 Tax=Menopon gallinae TaxID=328185 RepID=A0AAW2HLS4_9NEOP
MTTKKTVVVQRSVLPEKLKALERIRFKVYRRYRTEYITDFTLLDLSSAVVDSMPLGLTLKTPLDVAEFVKELGFPEYQEAFLKNRIDGKKLVLVEADKLPKMNIKNFDNIKTLTAAIRNLCHTDQEEHKRCIDLPYRRPGTLYLFYKSSRTGPIASSMRPSDYFRRIKIIREETTVDQRYYALLNHWNRIPPYREWCPHVDIGLIQRINPMTGTKMRMNFHPNKGPYLLKPLCFYSLCKASKAERAIKVNK